MSRAKYIPAPANIPYPGQLATRLVASTPMPAVVTKWIAEELIVEIAICEFQNGEFVPTYQRANFAWTTYAGWVECQFSLFDGKWRMFLAHNRLALGVRAVTIEQRPPRRRRPDLTEEQHTALIQAQREARQRKTRTPCSVSIQTVAPQDSGLSGR